MSLRSKTAVVALCALLLCGCGNTIDNSGLTVITGQNVHSNVPGTGSDAQNSGDNGEKPAEEAGVSVTQSVTMYKGEALPLEFSNANGLTPEIRSSDDAVAEVSGNTVNAKKAGIAEVTVDFKDGDSKTVSTAKLAVEVKISRFDKSPQPVKPAQAAAGDLPSVVLTKAMKPGEESTIVVSGAEKADFASSDENVVSVSADGKITAKADGQAEITATLTAGGKQLCQKTTVIVSGAETAAISDEELDSFFSEAVFVGSSIGEGMRYYFNSFGEGYMGDPLMLSRDCYGLFNDSGMNGDDYQLLYEGVAAPVKEHIKKCGKKYVFLNIGTNDIFAGGDRCAELCTEMIDGIKELSPNVVVYYETLTPVMIDSVLDNAEVDRFNELMQQYCAEKPDVNYIDITTMLKNPQGGLAEEYTSDHYVHLNTDAYELWVKKLREVITAQLLAEHRAEDAVLTYEESGTDAAKAAAQAAVDKLEDGAFKSSLQAKL